MTPGMGLIRAIENGFDIEELKTLCFQLGGGGLYDSLPAEGLSGKARELVLWSRRFGKEGVLIAACYDARPGNVFFDRAIERVPSTDFQGILPAPESNGTKRLTGLRLARIEGEQTHLAHVQSLLSRRVSATFAMSAVTLALVFLLLIKGLFA